jgi:hypothetical protein
MVLTKLLCRVAGPHGLVNGKWDWPGFQPGLSGVSDVS